MQDVNSIRQMRYVYAPVRIAFDTESNLSNASAHAWHRLPVVRVKILLNPIELAAHVLTGGLGNVAQVIER